MAVTLSDYRDELKRRLRVGTEDVALDTTNVLTVAAAVQATLNYSLRRLLATGTFTAATSATVINLTTTSIATSCTLPLSLYESTRTLQRLPDWRHFQQYDLSWRNSTATRAEAWSPIGSNMIAVYPAPSTGVTYSCVFVKDTSTSITTASNFQLPDHDIDLVYTMSEIVWLTHLRYLPEATKRLDHLAKHVSAYTAGPGGL